MASAKKENTVEKKTPQESEEKRITFLCNIKYRNTLPEFPCDLKSVSISSDLKNLAEYTPTSFESSYQYQNFPVFNLGIKVNLIDENVYQNNENSKMDKDDEKLLKDDNPEDKMLVLQDNERSIYEKTASWLRHISTKQTYFQPKASEKPKAKVKLGVNKEEIISIDRKNQIKLIEKSFKDNKIPIINHHSKPGVYAVETLNVFPDFKNWKYPCSHVIFDCNPIPNNEQMDLASQAIIRGVYGENKQFVGYFLPTDETITKNRQDAAGHSYDDNYEYKYKIIKYYNWCVETKSDDSFKVDYCLVQRPEGIFYNELETRVHLDKICSKDGLQNNIINTTLSVHHVPINENVESEYKEKEKQLKPQIDDE